MSPFEVGAKLLASVAVGAGVAFTLGHSRRPGIDCGGNRHEWSRWKRGLAHRSQVRMCLYCGWTEKRAINDGNGR
jgi:hypothetical protein